MLLDERKMKILQAIIDDYIDTAEPIGSRTIARKHKLGLSSATIRNEMADLEEMGFLEQPHTSAGRIPSDKGYRLYVDQLMKVRELSAEEIDSIKDALEIKINEMTQLIRQASAIMSKITRYTSMAITPQMSKSVLKAIQVVSIEPGKALVVVVTNTGMVRNALVRLKDNPTQNYLIRVSNLLNEKLSGLTLEQITLPLIAELKREIGPMSDPLLPILDGVTECINSIDRSEVYLEGTTNIFNHPEFRDIIRAQEFLHVLDEKDLLFRILRQSSGNMGIRIYIGTENEIDEIKDLSLVTTTYNLGDISLGSIGVIGPTRMEYSKVISSMRYIKKKINEEISKLIGGDTEFT